MSQKEIVGLIPAAGLGSRISPLPCSKEILPIDFGNAKPDEEAGIKVISSYLLDRMKVVGLEKVFIVIRKGKWDIPEYFGNGDRFDLRLAYLVIDESPGAPFTLNEAFSFVRDKRVLFGFPDILFHPEDAFSRLLKKQEVSDADVTLGLFPAYDHKKVDMVKTDEKGCVTKIVIKPDRTELEYSWIIAVWNPVFTEFINSYLSNWVKTDIHISEKINKELFVGDLIQKAINEGLYVNSILFGDGKYIDIGTIKDLKKAVKLNFK